MIVQSDPIVLYIKSKIFANITPITSVKLFERPFLFAQILIQRGFASNSPPLDRQSRPIACSHGMFIPQNV